LEDVGGNQEHLFIQAIKVGTLANILSLLRWIDERDIRRVSNLKYIGVAAKYNRLDMLLVLMDRLDEKDEDGLYAAITNAAKYGSKDVVEYFWPQIVDEDYKRRILFLTALSDSLEIFKEIVESRSILPNYQTLEAMMEGYGIVDPETGMSESVSGSPAPKVLRYLLSIISLSPLEILDLLTITIRNQRFNYAIILADRLDRKVLDDYLPLYIDLLINKDALELYRYLIEERGVDISLDLPTVLRKDAVELFTHQFLSSDRLNDLLLDSIKAGALNIVKKILTSDTGVHEIFNEEGLLFTAIEADERDIAIYLLTESRYADSLKYNRKHNVLDDIADDLMSKGIDVEDRINTIYTKTLTMKTTMMTKLDA